ncbi:MAG: SMC-Scp complex subunit ScpB [Actinomycetota bacterium]|jgi:segregation and condensation protein B
MRQKVMKMTDNELVQDTLLNENVDIEALVEALLLISDEPLTSLGLAATLGFTVDKIDAAFNSLVKKYNSDTHGIEIRTVAGGYRFYTKPSLGAWIERYVRDGQVARLTQASLETLAVIAYKQPVTRARISAIRGVNVDGVVKTLETRGLIEIVQTDPESGALLYGTTQMFLEKLGIADLKELPEIAGLLPDISADFSDIDEL